MDHEKVDFTDEERKPIPESKELLEKQEEIKTNMNNTTNKVEDTDSYAQRCKNNNNTSLLSDITFSRSDDGSVENNSNLLEKTSQESNEKEFPIDDELKIESSDVSEQNSTIKAVIDNITKSKEFTNSSLKINGDHVILRNQSAEDIEDEVSTAKGHQKFEDNMCMESSVDKTQEISPLKQQSCIFDQEGPSIEYNRIDLECLNHSNDPTNLSAEPEQKESTREHGENEIEENSRDSSSNSNRSISSVKSSSSQHLVIDQPPIEEKKVPLPRSNAKRKTNKRRLKRDPHTIKKTTIEGRKKQTKDKDKNCTQINMDPENSTLKSIVTAATSPDTEEQQSRNFENSRCQCGDSKTTFEAHQQNCSFYKPLSVYYYKCSSCGTYHEKWSLFLHIYEYHDRFLCLYCIKCFPTAEKLSLHLEIKHDLEQNHFNTEEAFRSSALICNGYSLETRFLMCCTCQHIFRENAAFTEHLCAEYMKSCSLCGQKGRHTNQCKAHPFAKRRNKKKVKEKSKKSIEITTTAAAAADNASIIKELTAPIQPQQQQQNIEKPITHSEDSNSSSNMVIDESCNMVAHSMIANINPFKVLDESERLEKQLEDATSMATATVMTTTPTMTYSSLPPPPLFSSNDGEMANSDSNILKFKLRVPKEFQKPVDEIISSSESDDLSCEDVILEEGGNQIERNSQMSIESPTEKSQMDEGNDELTTMSIITEKDYSKGSDTFDVSCNIIDDESMDDEEPNLHLARILQEIEQTKLDIKRTKETIHNTQKADTVAHMPSNNNESPQAADRQNSEKNWTPTPPASPNISASTTTAGLSSNPELIASFEQSLQNSIQDSSIDAELSGTNEILDSMNNQQGNNEAVALTTTTTTNENDSQLEIKNFSSTSITMDDNTPTTVPPTILPPPPSDGIEVANDDFLVVELQLDRPLHKYEIVEFVRICLKSAYPFCLYCNHARRIAVNAESLVLHLLSQHRFSATVDSITAEELQPDTIVAKLKSFLPQLKDEYLNSNSYCTMGDGTFTRHFNERIFECFQCRFVTSTHKELYLHNRKMHLRTAILCFMCRCNFFSFSEILCHICPGVPHKVSIFEIKFRCCLCNLDNIPSPFRLMVHLRKRHFACDICLEDCRDQSKLSSHVWKHKLHHLCYRCGIAYRNKMDITKHLFWKHGTESTICKRCLNKRWPHVYHFCVPPTTFVCDVCQLCFSKAVYLTVHKRLHEEDFRYPCTEENCEAKFISRKLLLKHAQQHQIISADTYDCKDLSNEKIGECTELQDDEQQQQQNKQNEFDKEAKDCNDVKEGIPKVEPEEEQESDTLQSKRENLAEGSNCIPMDVEAPIEKPQKKKKKKRGKESLEDLNLTVPNLSESGSSSESESESKSTKCEDDVPQVMLSPLSESGDIKEQKQSETDETENPVKVLEIWKNFLQAQQASVGEIGENPQFIDYTEDDYPTPKTLHVCYSDHDYCSMFRPPTPVLQKNLTNEMIIDTKSQRNSQSPRRPSSRNSNNSSSSSDVSSDESSSSNCTCGTKCSCSSSSSNSSSSENSDSSSASRKQQRKKLSRSGGRHRKSESVSPLKSRSVSEMVNVIDTDENNSEMKKNLEKSDSSPEPTINESDLETAESESDEEYYDEHPQKLANELLSKKRAQLMARTLLSPSHNYDIVENSRPSTPSLPEDVVYEKRKKKKKRERKYSGRKFTDQVPDGNVEISNNHNLVSQVSTTTQEQILLNEVEHGNFSTSFETTDAIYAGTTSTQAATFAQSLAVQNTAVYTPRISEGSSCSDVDGSLKRSKRTRRPNKFYGYTSDDESMGSSGFGQSLVIGMRAFKPQPPPQLVWNKEDLPTPSKSILNSKKTPRASKRQEDFGQGNVLSETDHDKFLGSSLPKKKRIGSSLQNLNRRRSTKPLGSNWQHLPPIPRLKIRPSLFGISNNASNSFKSDNFLDNSQLKNSTVDADASSDASSEDDQPSESVWNKTPVSNQIYAERERLQAPMMSTPVSHLTSHQHSLPILPRVLPPTPQTTVFNHKIPPALLPNPDFATLQYFKANNIRYPIRPPAGARAARDGESVYCYCRCPYDEVSEMIACDGDSCLIEWFHFECVGIMVAPQGKWFCAECRPHYSEDLYPTTLPITPGIMTNVREH